MCEHQQMWHFQPVKWPTTGPLTKEKVEEHCRLKIEGSIVGKLCGRLLHITFHIEIEGCMEDVKVRLPISKTHAQARTGMHIYTHTHVHRQSDTRTHARTHALTHARTHTHTHTHTTHIY